MLEDVMDRATWTRVLTRAAVALVLVGLFAMHGLPDAMAVTATRGMSAQPVEHQHRDEPVDLLRGVGGAPAAMPGGCGLDHAGCVAVLRDTPRTDAPALVAADTSVVGRATGAVSRPSVVDSRAPPGVSLVGLGISRT